MRARLGFAALGAAVLLGACQTAPQGLKPLQDISFIGGCWETHADGKADFLRLLRDREHPGGFVGDQSQIRPGEPSYTSRWTFAPDGVHVLWESTTGLADEISRYKPAPDLPAEDRIVPPGTRAAFFWDRPGQLYLKVARQGDLLRISRHPAKGSSPNYASVNWVYFEGRLSGCD